ncbi:MAG: hypothetical protein F6K09_27125 [Merismopedia sp. SIO2A8]|nr:hypothetical protein [Merismopedia sp. SIO2A8]
MERHRRMSGACHFRRTITPSKTPKSLQGVDFSGEQNLGDFSLFHHQPEAVELFFFTGLEQQ